MTDEITFDCRIISNGKRCEYLKPWNDGYKDEITRICTCKALNMVVFPNYKNEGKINQKLMYVKPLFDCPKMHELRLNNRSPHMLMTITKNSI